METNTEKLHGKIGVGLYLLFQNIVVAAFISSASAESVGDVFVAITFNLLAAPLILWGPFDSFPLWVAYLVAITWVINAWVWSRWSNITDPEDNPKGW